jgi:hypothetical protein
MIFHDRYLFCIGSVCNACICIVRVVENSELL